jgi:hypothetical protein
MPKKNGRGNTIFYIFLLRIYLTLVEKDIFSKQILLSKPQHTITPILKKEENHETKF